MVISACNLPKEDIVHTGLLLGAALFFGLVVMMGFFDGIGLLFMSRKRFDDFYG